MKRIVLVSLVFGLMVSSSFGITLPTGVGAKYGSMAGAGASIVDDITCAYYNPAGIVKTGNVELKLGAGAASEGMNDIIATFGNAPSPEKFLADNYTKIVNINGGLNALVGVNFAKIGLSVIPVASLTFDKPTENTFTGSSIIAMGAYEGLLTLGYSFGIPALPIASLDVGANIKSSNTVMAVVVGTGATTAAHAVANLSGIGYDLGATASINTGLMPINVAVVLRDIGTALKGKIKTENSTYDPIAGTTTTVLVSDVDAGDTTIAPATVIGVSTVIPGVGVKVAVDLDTIGESKINGVTIQGGNLTHIGVEYPILGIIALRAGQVSGKMSKLGSLTATDVQQTTFGAGFNLGAVINVAMMTDNNNSKNNSTIVDFGFAF
ncbi:MAG: hypothetical protein ABIH22_00540 [Candidatus Margulisiibacteriota bacterium]